MRTFHKTTILAVASLAVFAKAEIVVGGGFERLAEDNPTERFNVVEIAESKCFDIRSVIPTGAWAAPLVFDRRDAIRLKGFNGNPPTSMERLSKNAGGTIRIAIALPETLKEGGPAGKAYVKLSRPLKATAIFNLFSNNPEQLKLPQTLEIPAGKTLGSFDISVIDDKLINLTRDIATRVSIGGNLLVEQPVRVKDDETPPKMQLILPRTLVEGRANSGKNASFTLDRPADVALMVYLKADVGGKLRFPPYLRLKSGQTRHDFKIAAQNDDQIDIAFPVTLTASREGMKTAKGKIIISDNEARILTLVPPTTIPEGGMATGTVKVPGTMGYALDVALTNDHPEQITLPEIVRIPAGQSEATFTIFGKENPSRDGSREVSLAAAAPQFIGSNATSTVRDNEVVSYRVGGLVGIVNVSSPTTAVIFGTDVEGNDILNFSGAVKLEVILPDGAVQSVVPATVTLEGSAGWRGSLTLPPVSSAPLRVRASDGAGNWGESAPIDVMRVLPMTAQNLVWDATRGRIFASATKFVGALHDNQVVAIDPESLQVTGSGRSNFNPRNLVLSSEGKFLYQSCASNGFIYKFDPDTLNTLSQFSAGVDSNSSKLYAADLCPVEGAPDSVVVSRYYGGSTNYHHHSVAIFDNGVMRPVTTGVFPLPRANVIEPSSDPSVYFGYCNEGSGFELMRMHSSASGITIVTSKRGLLSGFYEDMKSSGDRIFATTGIVVDGGKMKKLGQFDNRGLVFPDLASARVFYLENPADAFGSYQSIAAYDPVTLRLIRRLALPVAESAASNFIRWGDNGIAYLAGDRLVLINSSQLVPSAPAANLAVTIETPPGPASIGTPVTYTVRVANSGPNVACNTRINALLSDGQTLQNAAGSFGVPVTSGSIVTLAVGDLAVNSSATLTLTTVPQSAGQVSCKVGLLVDSLDPVMVDNSADRFVEVDYDVGTDEFKPFKLDANNLVDDPRRGVFWASLSKVTGESLENMVVSFNPANGDVSAPIPLDGDPVAQSMAISANGRYLYLGIVGEEVVQRIDLDATPPTRVLIPLSRDPYEWAAPASQIQVLEGDGTSIVVATGSLPSIIVVDGLVKRAIPDFWGFAPNLERTTKPNVFVSYDKNSNADKVYEIGVSPTSVATTRAIPNLISGYRVDIRGDGKFLLSSSGRLIDSDALTLIADLGMAGRPCVDAINRRAFLVNGNSLHVFDAATGSVVGTVAIPTAAPGDWAQSCIRWGTDGLAILGKGEIFAVHSSLVVPGASLRRASRVASNVSSVSPSIPAGDSDGDGLADTLEYFFGTSPSQFTANPVKLASTTAGGMVTIHLAFPRRPGIAWPSYGYEFSHDLIEWVPVGEVSETVGSAQAVDGVEIENIDATIVVPQSNSGFVRLRWLQP